MGVEHAGCAVSAEYILFPRLQQVEVVENLGGDVEKTHVKLKPAALNNDGARMCFNMPDPLNVIFYLGRPKHLTLVKCPGYSDPFPLKVQFYLETFLNHNSVSQLIATDTTVADGFVVDVLINDLPENTFVVVKSKATLGSDITTATVAGVVVHPERAPRKIILSNSVIAENSAINVM